MPVEGQRSFGDLLRSRRLVAGLTQEELAAQAGLSTRGISDLERGARLNPRKSTLDLLSDALGLSPEERAAWEATRCQPGATPGRTPGQRRDTSPAREPAVPRPLSAFIGREHDLHAVGAMLADPAIRLVTLTGTGGIGKTRLALAVAIEVADQFPDGVLFVPLALISQTDAVPAAIAAAMDVRPSGPQAVEQDIADALRSRQALLILDNFEQVSAAAPVVAGLLAACPGLKVLMTSRSALRLRGEHQYLVGPMSLPDARRPLVESVRESTSGQLLLQRAREHAAALELTRENAPALAAICARMEGLPLAIELVAPWLRLLSPHDLAGRLEQRLPLLTGGLGDLPARQRTMRETIRWSYQLLEDHDQRVLRYLSVFVGGWTVEAAAAVIEDDTASILNDMLCLNGHNLVETQTGQVDGSRFGMLEMIREFGLEQLGENIETEAARDRHASYFLGFSERIEEMLLGASSSIPFDLIDVEFANLRAAFSWFVEQGNATAALRMVSGLQWYWVRRASLIEAQDWLDIALGMTGPIVKAVHAAALNTAGIVAAYRGEASRSAAFHSEALQGFEDIGDRHGVASSLHGLARAARMAGDVRRSAVLNEKSLTIFRELDSWIWIAGAAINLAGALDDPADAVRKQGLAHEALSIARAHGDLAFQSICLNFLAEVALQDGDVAGADDLVCQSLALNRTMRTSRHSITSLEIRAAVATAKGHLTEAVSLFGSAANLRQRVGFPVGPEWRYRRAVELLQHKLGDAPFRDAWTSGERMSVDGAISYALAGVSGTGVRLD